MNAVFRSLVRAGVAVLLAATTTGPVVASDDLLQRELQQQQIRASTQRVAEQLEQLIGEFERNGLDGEDLKVLKAIHAVLWNLTDKAMERVVTLLQSARAASDPITSQRGVVQAYAAQKNITVQLRQLLVEYQRQQVVDELAARFLELSNRQGANLRDTISLAQLVPSPPGAQLAEAHQTLLNLQTTEQQSLRDETKQLLQKLATLTGDERPRTALKQAEEGKLTAVLDSAINDLNTAKLLSAAGNEKIARDQLRSLARLLGPPKDTVAALRQAAHDLDAVMQNQRAVIDQTKPLVERADPVALRNTETAQAENVDRADLVQNDLAHLAPAAAEQTAHAIAEMQEARQSLAGKNTKEALAGETKALDELTQARQSLADQLAKAEAEEHKATDPLTKLREQEKLIDGLVAEQKALKQQAADAEKNAAAAKALAPRQDDLAQRTQEAQRQTAPASAPAAESLADAAANMHKAEQALGQEPATVAAAQNAALSALNQAREQVRQQLAKLDEAKQELAALETLLQKLATIIQDQQKLELSTATAVTAPAKAPPVRQLATNQQNLADATESLRTALPDDAKAADPHLAAARQDMTDAKAQLDKAAPKTAHPEQEQALANLYKAKAALEQLQQQLADALDQPNAPANAQAAEALAQAQEQVAQAQDQLNQAGAAQMQQIQQQQEQIAQGLAEQAQAQPGNQPLAQAQQAAQQAARQLGQNNLPGAMQAMQQAQAGMQQAMQSGPSGQALPQLAQQQAATLAAAQQLAGQQQTAAAQAAMQQAAEALQNAAAAVGAAAATPGGTPSGAAAPMQSAQGSLSDAAAAASGSPANAGSAAASAAAAQAAMAQAQAAMNMASGGMPGQTPSSGQGTGNGTGNLTGGPQAGHRVGVEGQGQFIGLPARDRAAIRQSQAEKYPEEYGGMIEQYMKNLADETDGGTR